MTTTAKNPQAEPWYRPVMKVHLPKMLLIGIIKGYLYYLVMKTNDPLITLN